MKKLKNVGIYLGMLGVILVAATGDSIDFMSCSEYIRGVIKISLPIYIGFIILLIVEFGVFIKDRIYKSNQRKAIMKTCRARDKFNNIMALTNLKEN